MVKWNCFVFKYRGNIAGFDRIKEKKTDHISPIHFALFDQATDLFCLQLFRLTCCSLLEWYHFTW